MLPCAGMRIEEVKTKEWIAAYMSFRWREKRRWVIKDGKFMSGRNGDRRRRTLFYMDCVTLAFGRCNGLLEQYEKPTTLVRSETATEYVNSPKDTPALPAVSPFLRPTRSS